LKIFQYPTLLALGTNFESARPAHISIRSVHDLVKEYVLDIWRILLYQVKRVGPNSILKQIGLYTEIL